MVKRILPGDWQIGHLKLLTGEKGGKLQHSMQARTRHRETPKEQQRSDLRHEGKTTKWPKPKPNG